MDNGNLCQAMSAPTLKDDVKELQLQMLATNAKLDAVVKLMDDQRDINKIILFLLGYPKDEANQ